MIENLHSAQGGSTFATAAAYGYPPSLAFQTAAVWRASRSQLYGAASSVPLILWLPASWTEKLLDSLVF